MSETATPMGPPGHITSATEPFPSSESAASLAAATTTHRHASGRWAVATRRLPISKAGPIDAMTADLGIPVPEMIFGDNLVSVAHAPSGWRIAFTARDALDAVDKTGERMLQVSYARDWSASRHLNDEEADGGGRRGGGEGAAPGGAANGSGGGSSITMKEVEVVKPFDWSYSTEYRGTESEGSGGRRLAPSDREIPIELLKRRDPILFFDNVVLYESELDDNGISMYSVKVRVHDQRMLLLARLYMRLDNVIVRIRDTRVYVDFETDEVIREYTKLELSFAEVQHRLRLAGYRPDEIPAALRDANQVAELMAKVPQAGVEQVVESVSLA